ncbi:hypothetical protein [Viridibacillus arvi]|uniref:hypothetical protein n=1 Tax=Viridibacillus arvi TaxID=263475 RepID=UPI00187B2D56|nr:hypothetical protein [Viridibacillus sp. JNUCC-6]QOV10925.1 hypothetical protein JNUCC6_20545 [Viridibacillus sp. JNUCC-6]
MEQKVKYAKEIGKIGEAIKRIGNDFGNAPDMKIQSTEDIKKLITKYDVGLSEFKQTESYFKGIDSPFGFEHDHHLMVNAFSEYVKATEDMVSAVKVEPQVFTEEPYLIAQKNQSVAAGKIAKIATELAQKMFP